MKERLMLKVGDLVQIKETALKRSDLFCEPGTVFKILKVYDSSYMINARRIDSNIVVYNGTEYKCFVSFQAVVPYIASRESIECML